MSNKILVRKIPKKELLDKHDYNINIANDSTNPTFMTKQFFIADAYSKELQRRSNLSTNIIMIICTIFITIMTAVILWATLIGADIFCCGV